MSDTSTDPYNVHNYLESEAAVADYLRLKSELFNMVSREVKSRQWNQEQARANMPVLTVHMVEALFDDRPSGITLDKLVISAYLLEMSLSMHISRK